MRLARVTLTCARVGQSQFGRIDAIQSAAALVAAPTSVIGLDANQGKMLKYLDIGDKFLTADKTLTKDIMPDALHPNLKGYQIWAEAIIPTVKQMMGVQQ